MAKKKDIAADEPAVETVVETESSESGTEAEAEPEEKEEPEKTSAHKFTKAQLIGSKKFAARRDILSALLKKDQLYTISEVEQLVDEFMEGKVNE